MDQVLLVIHLLIAIALVAVVLLQRSEGGALGIGGGGGGNGLVSARGAGNLLTRVTAWLAAGFFTTSILLTLIARQDVDAPSVLDNINDIPAVEVPAAPAQDAEPAVPQVPVTD